MSSEEFISDCLSFANKRLNEFENLNKGNLAGADRKVREQLFREFFFHLVSAIDFLVQFINSKRNLCFRKKDVKVLDVKSKLKKLNPADPIIPILDIIYPKIDDNNLPPDPYSELGCHTRIIIYRNFITHRSHNPICFRTITNTVHLYFYPNNINFLLDPNDKGSNVSDKTAIDEMHSFYQLLKDKCEKAIILI